MFDTLPFWELNFAFPVTGMMVLVLLYPAYFFAHTSEKVEQFFFQKWGDEGGRYGWRLWQCWWAGLLLGAIPVGLIAIPYPMHFSHYGLGLEFGLIDFYWMGALAVILGPVGLACGYWTRDRERARDYLFTAFQLLTAIPLVIAWEFFFRGFLLYMAMPEWGPYPSLAVVTAVYMLLHLPHGVAATYGALGRGFLLGMATLATGTIWAAAAGHWMFMAGRDGMRG